MTANCLQGTKMNAETADVPVLVLLNSLEMGGAQKNAVELADVVRRHGYCPTVMAWNLADDSNTSIHQLATQRGLTVVRRDRPRHTLAAANVVNQVAQEHRCRLVHSYGWTMFTAFWGPGRWGRLPLVSTIYEMHVYAGPPYRTSVIFGTEYQHLQAKRRGPSYLIPPPVDTEYDNPSLFPSSPRDGMVRIAIISRLAEEMKAKGIETAINVMRELPANVQLIVTGDGDAAPRLKMLGDTANRALGRQAIIFTGNALDARPYYAQADIILGMGGSAARGLAFAKPLVALGEYGWSETFTPASAERLSASSYWSDEREGFPERRLVKQLEPLIDSKEYREVLGQFGQEFVQRRQGLHQMGENLARIYAAAIRQHTRSPWYLDAASTVLAKRTSIAKKLLGLDAHGLGLRH